MSRVCELTKKRPLVGNNVSHANNKTKRRFEPNLQRRRFWDEEKKMFITLNVCTQAIRIIDKLGLAAALKKFKDKNSK